jgi:hypothetical protein
MCAFVLCACGGGGGETSEQAKPGRIPDAKMAEVLKNPERASKIIDPTNTFYALWGNASMQPIVGTISHKFRAALPDSGTVSDVVFDYSTKAIAFDKLEYSSGYPNPNEIRCVNGKAFEYRKVPFDYKEWRSRSDRDCTLDSQVYFIGDGMNTGGLNEEQATRYIESLQNREGFVNIENLSVVNVGGKGYLRFDVNFVPTDAGDGIFYGAQHIDFALQRAGIDLASHPYARSGAGGDGRKVIMYFDAETQLPAYSEAVGTITKDLDGTESPVRDPEIRRTEYRFGGSVPALDTATGPRLYAPGWPQELK